MPASYPGAIKTFTTKTNKVDLVDAVHINDLQLEVNAIETELGIDVAGTAIDLVTRLARSLDGDGGLRRGTAFPGTNIGDGTPFYRTDLDALYIYDGLTWDPFASTSNVIYAWVGRDGVSQDGNFGHGFVASGISDTPIETAFTVALYAGKGDNSSYHILMPAFKWTKIPGINTITCHLRIWGISTTARVSIGGQTVTVTLADNTPTWRTAFTVDISGLINGTTYDILVEAISQDTIKRITYLSGIVLLGS